MRSSAAHVAGVVRGHADLAAQYEATFGVAPSTRADDALLLDVAMALAAFQETLTSPRAPFDDLRDALAAGAADAPYPADARRGLRLFVGKARCAVCHAGPLFSDGELHASRIAGAKRSGRPVRTPSLRDVAATGPYMHDGSVARLCDAVRWHAGPRPATLTPAERRDLVTFLRTLGSEPEPPFVDAAAWRCDRR
jgi:cytochrome c peroxidase